MANCLSYECTDDLGVHTPNDCGEELLAGISGMVVLNCNHELLAPDEAQINAEIAAGRAYLVDSVKISIDEPSPIMIDSNIVGSQQRLINYNRSGAFMDGNVSAINSFFYDGLFDGRTFGGIILYLKGTEESDAGAKVYWINSAVTFNGGLAIQNNNDQIMIFNGKFTWRQKAQPTFRAAPINIFV